MEPVYVEATINDTRIRINKNDSMDIYSWREYKIKPPDWFKRKATLHTDNKGYKSYHFPINYKHYLLSRVVYKAHNPDWDITDTSKTNEIDHININPTDNRIENLRILTHHQNSFNRRTKGYSWNKRSQKWIARIRVNGKEVWAQSFTEEADAKNAYLEAKEKYHIIAL